MPRKQIAFRVTDEQFRKLEELAKIMGKTKTDVMIDLIIGEHDRIHGNPGMKELIKKFNDMAEEIRNFSSEKF